MNKIFTNDKTIYFLNHLDEINFPLDSVYEYSQTYQLKIKIQDFEKNRALKSMAVLLKDKTSFQKTIQSLYKIIHAAGGIVRNERDESLFIFRNGKWDLPKGKMEDDEKEEEAALREVEEECGIHELEISKKLCSTYHTYKLGDDEIIKISHWFCMNYSGQSMNLVPQFEEGITIACWKNQAQVEEAMLNTYHSIAEVIDSYQKTA